MLSIKPGVSIRGLRVEVALALSIINASEPAASWVVTSGVDSRHSKGSLHYAGAAVDLRLPQGLEVANQAVVQRLKSILGAEFDVVLEKDHIHVEFQPKEPMAV